MKIVLQKVASANVAVEGECISAIQQGYVLLLGIMQGDTSYHADLLIKKLLTLRLFANKDGKLNDLNIEQVHGEILLVSQFTLAGTLKKGSRPDYTAAEQPDTAKKLYEYFIQTLIHSTQCNVATGTFGAHMQVELINDGPVTLLLEQ
jgi:D-aminoacyl-tRNA deacylase